MKNVLITGGAGFIGSNFIRWLMQHEPSIHVTNLDALTYAGRRENLADLEHQAHRYTFIHGDIKNTQLVRTIIRDQYVDTIVHFAAESHVDRSILAPTAFIETNVNGTISLLEASRAVWLGEKIIPPELTRFHHVSTDEVFGSLNPGDPAFHENTPYSPNSPYAASKAASDHLVRAYHHTYGLPVSISNCSNNYGPFQFPEKLIPLIILNAITGKPLPVYGDGMQVRDWLYVDDHCSAIQRIIQEGKTGETYNIGGNNQPTNIEIVRSICQILNEKLPDSNFIPHEKLITYVSDRPGHDRRYAMDIRKITRDLGWVPSESLKSGLEKTIEWYLQNMEWVDVILKDGDYANWLNRNYYNRGGKKR